MKQQQQQQKGKYHFFSGSIQNREAGLTDKCRGLVSFMRFES